MALIDAQAFGTRDVDVKSAHDTTDGTGKVVT